MTNHSPKNKSTPFRKHTVFLRAKNETGFSLIEFMVASTIGVIVLLAAGTTYFTTQRINAVAMARLNAQQDLRNAANLILTDARQAGTFGCASLGSNEVVSKRYLTNGIDSSTSADAIVPGENSLNKANAYGLAFTDTKGNTLPFQALLAKSKMNITSSIFQLSYGTGFASLAGDYSSTASAKSLTLSDMDSNDPVARQLAQGYPVAISSCKKFRTIVGTTKSTETISFKNNFAVPLDPNDTDGAAFSPSQITLSRITTNLYFIANIDGNKATTGLYRISFNDDMTTMSPPQLFVLGAKSMDMQFGYVKNSDCSTSAASTTEETFKFYNKPTYDTSGQYPRLPAIIRITITMNPLTSTMGEDAGTPSVYVIDATVRAGNLCADRKLESS